MELGILRKLGVFMDGLEELAYKATNRPFLTFGHISPSHYRVEQFERILVATFVESGVGFEDIFSGGRTFETGGQLGCRVRFGVFAATGQ